MINRRQAIKTATAIPLAPLRFERERLRKSN